MAMFPIDLGAVRPLLLDPETPTLTEQQRDTLRRNIQICRDAIVFFTATGAAKGLGGHTGGPYDIVPEVLIADAFFRANPERFVPIFFDEAGHRVAIQYLMAALNGFLPPMQLTKYREAHAKLPGHPELGLTPGVQFSSGRLGHLWGTVNGVAMANPDRVVMLFGSDGSQQEGTSAEAARMAVAQGLSVKLVIDDNDVTIAGHPSAYLPGFDLAQTLAGHGLKTSVGNGEDLDDLYRRMCEAVTTPGPVALINKRPMGVGIAGLEGSTKGHDVIPLEMAKTYLANHGHTHAVEFLDAIEKPAPDRAYIGSAAGKFGSNRQVFGETVVAMLREIPADNLAATVRVFDADLAGSVGLEIIKKYFPKIFVSGGVMERTIFSAAAGFGMQAGRQGIFATFSAFLEMCISEITMARLNHANALCHFSHAGIDDMADNTCHFGLNNFFADNGLEEGDTTRLYFPADQHQMRHVVRRIFHDPGLRFVFSTRSKVPDILDAHGRQFFADDYTFIPGKDEMIRTGTVGFIVSYGDAVYRCLDAVEQLTTAGLDVGLINKPTLNVVDEEMMLILGRAPFVMVVESLNRKTGLGVRVGTWLLERGYTPRYAHLGTTREGIGGLWEHYYHQNLDSDSIAAAARRLATG